MGTSGHTLGTGGGTYLENQDPGGMPGGWLTSGNGSGGVGSRVSMKELCVSRARQGVGLPSPERDWRSAAQGKHGHGARRRGLH